MSLQRERDILLVRIFQDEKHTIGILQVLENDEIKFSCKALELPWRFNEKGISRVPAGTYEIVLEWSPKFQTNLWELKGVPNRSEAKIHVANFVHELNGCIGVGLDVVKIDGDNTFDITHSRKTLQKLHSALAGLKKTRIKIVDYDFD